MVIIKVMLLLQEHLDIEKDVQKLREKGYALGGSLENAVVVGDNNILNKGGLRFKDEFVRHKILDSIGDLYLAGYPVQGYFSRKKIRPLFKQSTFK